MRVHASAWASAPKLLLLVHLLKRASRPLAAQRGLAVRSSRHARQVPSRAHDAGAVRAREGLWDAVWCHSVSSCFAVRELQDAVGLSRTLKYGSHLTLCSSAQVDQDAAHSGQLRGADHGDGIAAFCSTVQHSALCLLSRVR